MTNRTILSLISLTALLSVGTHAHAEYCHADGNCLTGQVCGRSGDLSCVDSECGGVQEDCRCDSPDTGVCSPVTCNTEADCPYNMQCQPTGGVTCTTDLHAEAEACDPGTARKEPMPYQECVFAWEVECDSDADCGGAPFSCIRQMDCSCSTTANEHDAGAASTTPEQRAAKGDDCACEETGIFANRSSRTAKRTQPAPATGAAWET